MSRLRALAISAGFLCVLAIAGCGINPQPEPPSAETNSAGGAGGAGGGAGSGGLYGAGGHQAANPDGSPDVPPGTDDDGGGAGKRSGEFSNEDPSSNTDHNGSFGNFDDAGADAGDAGDDRAVADEQDDSGREQPPVPDAGLGSVMQ
jgi:hypothetical protein